MKAHIADTKVLARLLNRKKRHREIGFEVDLGLVLREILTWADKLVPSESGSILLDDPVPKLEPGKEGTLYFSACFGKRSASLVGTSLSDKMGIAGETYRKGRSHISKDVREDRKFYAEIDKKTGFKSRSIICAPIRIENSVVGVIELINRKGRINYDLKDLTLLEIFAGYTALLIQNALIGRNYEELSRRDDLTGLYNDRYFFSSLEYEVDRAVREGGEVTLIFFDLDHFKEVNDTYGHLAGSTVLREVGDILRSVFYGSNAIMTRYGGDEYAIVLRGTDISDAMRCAERIKDGILQNTFIKNGTSGGPPLNIKGVITCSIGVASLLRNILPGESPRETADALIKAADRAMYQAKEQGKNRVCMALGKRPKKAGGLRRKTGNDKAALQ